MRRPDLLIRGGVCIAIGENRPAIVREIPHFGLIPAFCPERHAFLALFRSKKSLKIAIIFTVHRRHFVRKSSANTSMIGTVA